MENLEIYGVEIQDKETGKLIDYQNYITLEEAEKYIKGTIAMGCLDNNEKMILTKYKYKQTFELIEQEILNTFDN